MTRARILLVEDEALIRLLVSEVLLEQDFDVLEACSGDEAMALLEQHGDFDLLLTDVHMPGRFDGIEVARRARVRQPDLPVVFATGRPDTLRAFGTLGSREMLLAKPFSPLEALRTVERLLGAHV